MKQIINKSLVVTCLCLFLFMPISANASIDNMTEVKPYKIWTIKFNREISQSEFDRLIIRVTDINKNNADIKKEPGVDKSCVIVSPPVEGYKQGMTYTMTVEICNKYSNLENIRVLKEISFSIEDKDPPHVTKVEAINNTDMIITFSEKVDKQSAEDITNYAHSFNYSNLTVLSAKLNPEGNVVKLITKPQIPLRNTRIVIENVKDLSGNTVVRMNALFPSNNIQPPYRLYSNLVANENTLLLVFNNEIKQEKLKDMKLFMYELKDQKHGDLEKFNDLNYTLETIHSEDYPEVEELKDNWNRVVKVKFHTDYNESPILFKSDFIYYLAVLAESNFDVDKDYSGTIISVKEKE